MICLAFSYFHYPNYEIAAASYTEQKKQAFSIGEFLTFAGGLYGNPDASNFTGSALVGRNLTVNETQSRKKVLTVL